LRTAVLLLLVLATMLCIAVPAWAADDEKPDLLSPRFDLGIWTIIIFVLFFMVLRKYAWGPMLEGLNKREQRIQGELDQARQERQAAETLRLQFQEQIAHSEERARTIIDEGRRDAQRLADDMIAKTKAEMQAEKDRLYRELHLAKDQALKELWNQAADLATLISTKAIRRQLTADDHRRLTDEALSELTQAAGRRQTVGSAT
jgi:F-type H+-transporting ATPase subunit b